MVVYTDTEYNRIVDIIRPLVQARGGNFNDLNKAQSRTAMDDFRTWFESGSTRTTINNNIPEPLKTKLNLKEKLLWLSLMSEIEAETL